MKKVFIVLMVLLFAAAAWGGEQFAQYSTKTSSGLVTTGKGVYHGVKVNTDATNAATVVVYDNTAASGTAIDPSTVYVTSSTMRVQASGSNPPRRYYNGLYVSITCAGTASVTVEFTPD
jgi:hypothetical protein